MANEALTGLTTNYQRGKALALTLLLCCAISLSAQTTDRDMLRAYQREDMTIWQAYVDTTVNLLYEYGFCGYIVSKDKEAAKPYVRRFREHVEAQRKHLPRGHYEMYLSAVYVYQLRLKESIHPIKAMNLAKEATRLAPNDPLVLSYYGTCLFYAPQPFGSKKEALEYFERADQLFQAPKWKDCWVREATKMYIRQCQEKLKKH